MLYGQKSERLERIDWLNALSAATTSRILEGQRHFLGVLNGPLRPRSLSLFERFRLFSLSPGVQRIGMPLLMLIAVGSFILAFFIDPTNALVNLLVGIASPAVGIAT